MISVYHTYHGCAKHTLSRLRPLNTFSVTAATLPPLFWSSHMTVRRSSCGNICNTCSTCAGLILFALDAPRPCAPGAFGALEEKYHRIARKPISESTTSCGRFIDCSEDDIAVFAFDDAEGGHEDPGI